MRILGIDPGSRLTGFGVVELSSGGLQYVASGCIRIEPGPLPDRLHTIYTGLEQLIEMHQPDTAAVEQVFMARNPDSALKLGQARGAAICALVRGAIPVHEYTALQIKQAVVGRGHADKAQVQHMVKVLLRLEGDPQADAADALACAICHVHTSAGQAAVRRGTAGAGA